MSVVNYDQERGWVTLATNDSYALGALVLARSLRRVNTSGKLAVMVTPGVTASMRETLSTEFDEVTGVNILDSEDSANLALLSRPELGITFTKLHCWRLTQFSKCVFLDADTLVLQNCDELFDRDEFSAAPDVGWPDCFNSGVFVFTPSIETYNRLLAFAVSSGSFDGGDQGLLNLYFNDWSVSDISRHLPFIYNMVASATYSYLPAFKVFGANVKIVHFIGSEKPWLMYFDSATRTVRAPSGQEHLQELLQSWWDIFRADVHRKLSPEMGGDDNLSATMVEQAGLAGAFAKMSLEGEKSPDQIGFEEQMRKHAWEQGHIDYLGKDSFDNIMKKIQASIAQTSTAFVTEAEIPKAKSPSPPKTEAVPQSQAVPEQSQSTIQAEPKTASVPVVQQPSQEVEEARLAAERQALEKKLAEQKRIAEQRLQEEKQAAEARATAEATAQKTAAAVSAPVAAPPSVASAAAPPSVASAAAPPSVASAAAPPSVAPAAAPPSVASAAAPPSVAPAAAPPSVTSAVKPPSAAPAAATPSAAPQSGAQASAVTESQSTSSAPEVPVAPPRKQSKVQEAAGGGAGGLWRNVGFRVGVGLSCVAVMAFAIYSASASTITSSVEEALIDDVYKHENHVNILNVQ